jgi:DNA replication protein DnaC
MEKNKIGLFLYGSQGRKKTTCATAILEYEIIRRLKKESPYQRISFCYVPDLLLELQGSFTNGAELSAEDIILRMASYDFLVMDGLGEGGKQTDFVIGSLGTIMHHRHADRNNTRTVITSNYTLQELAERVDARVSSRITEMCELIEFTGEDQRMKR